jgi:hypothetical protein
MLEKSSSVMHYWILATGENWGREGERLGLASMSFPFLGFLSLSFERMKRNAKMD